MADPTTVEAMTNTTPNSCVDVHCDCNTMWSFAQQFGYLRLSTATGDFKSKLIEDYEVRARRIAATYARFYLEQEDGSDLAKKGRFYWMALGAFASKTVACTIAAWQVQVQATLLSRKTLDGLGKGNFWLFQDISGWHYYYAKYSSTFETCLDSRDATQYAKPVLAQMNKLPWKAEALPKINNLKVSKEIKQGFALVKQIEGQSDTTKRPPLQLKHLLAIADHEQGVILQPLIYADPGFSRWIGVQRWPLIHSMSPKLELVFSSACSIDKSELKSVAPDDTKLEDFESRMKWIGEAAKDFHKLMQKQAAYMEGELRTMAGWVDMPDKK
ncbi:MAG: hypothetical protein ABI410_19725 [Rhodoferax sp.]|uniref:DUF2515 family protein n=1 Tax=Rhodoferax sp. TaxID=50421 RepID=UPI003262D3B4